MSDRASPPDSAILVLGDHPLKICYSRPSARGRTVFGGLVPYGRTWRTGANEPTLLHLPVAAEVAGVRLERGTYLLFTIPQQDAWTVLFNTSEAATPLEMFSDMTEVGRGVATVERLDHHVETFTIRGGDGVGESDFIIEWERLRARIRVRLLR
ncbi:MAG: DUF2911 domain-containing protein [Longimicrobiales bacterium]